MSTNDFRIGNHPIGPDHPPFVIAEMSGNHNGSLERALEIVDAIADSGAPALKLQTYTADTMTLNLRSGEFVVEDKGSLWAGRTLYDLYQEAHTPWDWHKPIFDRCRARGILGFSTPFDASAVDFLESLDVPAYKVASFENMKTSISRLSGASRPRVSR
jgi:sialic acid synthase SpsE